MRTLAVLLCSALCGVAHAQAFDFNRDCAKWIAQRGYSRDYIELKTGKIQRGWPQYWRGNVEKQDVQAGDVVMYFVPQKEKLTRVALVEEVRAGATRRGGGQGPGQRDELGKIRRRALPRHRSLRSHHDIEHLDGHRVEGLAAVTAAAACADQDGSLNPPAPLARGDFSVASASHRSAAARLPRPSGCRRPTPTRRRTRRRA
jgi:hypothetical protein